MSSVMEFINSLPKLSNEEELIADLNYIKKSSSLVNDALQKGFDVLQLASGDVEITEVKIVTYKYIWDQETDKFVRASTGTRQRKKRLKKEAAELEAKAITATKKLSEKSPAKELETV
jgi:hypothetical protein